MAAIDYQQWAPQQSQGRGTFTTESAGAGAPREAGRGQG